MKVSGAVRPIQGSLSVKGLITNCVRQLVIKVLNSVKFHSSPKPIHHQHIQPSKLTLRYSIIDNPQAILPEHTNQSSSKSTTEICAPRISQPQDYGRNDMPPDRIPGPVMLMFHILKLN